MASRSPERAAGTALPRLGVFDSGVGGLTVVAALRRVLPGVRVVFLGDTARLPYGTKSAATVARYTRNNVRFLSERGVEAVVVACNTASATGLETLESELPVWGVVIPGAREAVARSRGHVGVIATESTVRSGAYERALHALEPEILVTSRACPLLVPLVEEGWLEEPITERIIERYLEPVLAAGIDTLVLGCTHYPLLTPLIARVAAGVTLVDSAQAVSAEVARDWPPAREMGSPATASLEVLVTDSAPRFAEIAERILGEPVSMTWVDVEPAATKATEEVLP